MGFFPEGIELSDICSPVEILEEAQHEWEEHSDGLLLLRIGPAAVEGEDEMILDVYIVHNPSKRMAKLLSIAHRPNQSYPVEIRPESFDIPEYLRKSYTIQKRRSPSPLFSPQAYLRGMEGILPEVTTKTITNEWVCDTPAEFRSKLEEALSLGSVKSAINNIIAGTPIMVSEQHTASQSLESGSEDSEQACDHDGTDSVE
jgi:hypothetical protein